MRFYTYILYSKKLNKFYIGSTDDVNKRLAEHNRGKTTFTRTWFPWELVYKETFETRSDAFKHERYIKAQKSSKYIRGLIEKFNSVDSEHPDL